jgi:FtsZ-binding cell division protein ZapB
MDIKEYLTLPLETQRNILKDKISETVPRGEIKEAAHAAGLSDYTLYKARDPECETHNLIRPELLALMHHTGRLGMLDFLDGLFGRVAFRRPQAIESLAHVNQQITAVLRETTEAIQAVIGAVDDGSPDGTEITTEELATIAREIQEAHQQLAALEDAARQLHRRKDQDLRRVKAVGSTQ